MGPSASVSPWPLPVTMTLAQKDAAGPGLPEGSWDPHRAGQPGHLSQVSHSSDSAEAVPGSGWASWAGLPGRRDFPDAQVLRLLSWSPGRAQPQSLTWVGQSLVPHLGWADS